MILKFTARRFFKETVDGPMFSWRICLFPYLSIFYQHNLFFFAIDLSTMHKRRENCRGQV